MTGPNRRTVLGTIAATTLGTPLLGAAPAMVPGDETIALWPGAAPGAPARLPRPHAEQRSSDPAFPDRWLTGIDRPALTVRRPAKPNGTAMMLVPGGAYGFLAWDNEGEEQARWLTENGITCFILRYRLPVEGWADRSHVPLQDAQRAIRLIRAQAATFAIDASRIGVLGFSAGGHLAGSLATRHAERCYAPVDTADQLPARPDIAALIYPVVSMDAAFTHAGSRDNLLGPGASESARRDASLDRRIGSETPPIFLVHASDDGLVPIANSLALYQAMLAAGRPGELHAFDQGGHGFGARLAKTIPASAWPGLLLAYLRRTGVLAL